MYLCDCFFFFFKQKTAYEMRISDWSSDVCSSVLQPLDRDLLQSPALPFLRHGEPSQRYDRDAEDRGIADQGGRIAFGQVHKLGPGLAKPPGDPLRQADALGAAATGREWCGERVGRSVWISWVPVSLKKKKHK